jgi:dihydroxy-acid dehydratase
MIALVQEGDPIEIDVERRVLNVEIAPDELARRQAAWRPPAPRYRMGVMAKYANAVSSASQGAVTI